MSTAVVSLVCADREEAGVMALGASLALAGSLHRRVVLVARSIGAATRWALMRAFWDEVQEVESREKGGWAWCGVWSTPS